MSIVKTKLEHLNLLVANDYMTKRMWEKLKPLEIRFIKDVLVDSGACA